jgi:GMP synthase (glutamine-hydrolysing)
LIVKTGSALPELALRRGDYEDWIRRALTGIEEIDVCRVREGESLPDPGPLRAVVVTGSSAMVTDREAWSERTGAWLAAAARRGTPILAICYGHQLLADGLGGEVERNVAGREIGSVEVRLTEEGLRDPLFSGMPEVLRVCSSHQQSVLRLPAGARQLATNEAAAYQAYRFGERAWGTQFHPEWDHDVMRAYLEARREQLTEEGLDPEALASANQPSSHGLQILGRFASLI